MLTFPHSLVEIDNLVLETNECKRVWFLGKPAAGTRVREQSRLDEVTGSCYVVFPEMAAGDGPVSMLTIARGRPGDGASRMPSFWNPVELGDVLGGVYAHVTYDPSRSTIELGMNVGAETPDLLGVTLEGAAPELVCGRVLELYFEVSEERIFLSVHDRFAGGDLALAATAPSTGRPKHPWRVLASGHWWVTSGVDGRADRSASLPPGFGLSNLRITLGADNEEAMGSLLYRGELDHLAAAPPKRLSGADLEQFTRHVKSLNEIAKEIERFRLLLPAAVPERPTHP